MDSLGPGGYSPDMRRALAIGIDTYPMQPLSFCEADAREIALALEMDEHGFETRLLLNSDATRRGILEALAWLREAEEFSLLYASGHGWHTDHGTYYVAVDGTSGDEGIDVSQFPSLIGRASSRLMIYDFCHAGAASARNLSPIPRLTSEQLRNAVNGASQGEGGAVIAACMANQSAYEVESLKHGKLTHHLLDGLCGAAANAGSVSAHSLYDYVSRGFDGDLNQRPVWRGDIDGRIIIGTGFTEDSVAKPAELVSRETLDAYTREAKDHLADFHRKWSVSLDEWHSSGWRAATGSLDALLRWFDRTTAEVPELASHKPFTLEHQAARSRLSQLATVDVGTITGVGKIAGRIGSGAFGSVWQVAPESGPDVAYKLYHPGELHLADKLSRFERGFRAMEQLDHSHIVRVHTYTHVPVGFTMDFIDGPNLRGLAPANSLDEVAVLQLLTTIAETISYAHEMGVIHRDIKPENILVKFDADKSRWEPLLTDFDLAWFSTATQVTKEGFGAQFYSAPEQFARPDSKEAHAPAVDVYAFGQLMFYTIVGTDPQYLGDDRNLKMLTESVGRWTIGAQSSDLIEIFRRCTRADWKERETNLTLVSAELASIALNAIASTDQMDTSDFSRELLYLIAGGSVPEGTREVTSKSGRSRVRLQTPRERSGAREISFDVTFDRLTRTMVAGASNYGDARSKLIRRVDAALKSAKEPRVFRSGGDGRDQVVLHVERAMQSRTGISATYRHVVEALLAFETG